MDSCILEIRPVPVDDVDFQVRKWNDVLQVMFFASVYKELAIYVFFCCEWSLDEYVTELGFVMPLAWIYVTTDNKVPLFLEFGNGAGCGHGANCSN
jgi:hypothetical protein